MRRKFCKKEKETIKNLVKKMDLELYRIKVQIGDCDESNVIACCDFMLEQWNRIVRNRRGFFFKAFLGLIRELVIEVHGESCRPRLQLLCFADKRKSRAEKEMMRHLAFMSWAKALGLVKNFDMIDVEGILPQDVDKILDELMLPCVRVIESNAGMEDLLNSYQFHKRLCSRSGIVSARNMEYRERMER